jgi:hypothetical protein
MHDLLIVGVPLVAILAGQVFNWSALKDFKAEVKSEFSTVNGRLDGVQADLSEFYRVLRQHDKAIDVLEKRGNRE